MTRVTVWDVTGSTTVQPFDAVVVSLAGGAVFLPKGYGTEDCGKIDRDRSEGSSSGSPRQIRPAIRWRFPGQDRKNPGERARDRVGLHLDARRGHADALPR